MTGLETLRQVPLTTLSLGAIRPRGWLLDQLKIQAGGLSGHLDEFWPSIAKSKWIGGDADGWERGPYWLDGIVPLAVLLDDVKLKAKVHFWVDYILAHQHGDGWLGPVNDGNTRFDPWPIFVLIKAFAQWHEATGDHRLVPAMLRAVQKIDGLLDTQPLTSWASMRWPDFAWGLRWLHSRTGEPWLLETLQKIQLQGHDWREHFARFRFTDKSTQWTLEDHVVNHAMALKEPAIRFPLTSEGAALAHQWIATLDQYHGQATGVFSGDECLAGRSPSQGTELCAVVEYLFSLETLLAAFGDPEFADRLERIAFNALPATFTTDMWAHQYVQQTNQVVCKLAPDGERVYTSNGPDANLFGLEPHFGCCTANMHQGWPKVASHAWMATARGGLALAILCPSEVHAAVGPEKADVTIVVETDYPFRGVVTLKIKVGAPVRFPLHIRIPRWAEGATFLVNDESPSELTAGTFAMLEREWRDADTIVLDLPMHIEIERRFNNAATIVRGPLVYALQVGANFELLKGDLPHADWQVFPTTPWNYELCPNLEHSSSGIIASESPLSPHPFAPEHPPVRLHASAKRLPRWTLQQNCADAPPQSPVVPDSPLEQILLVPYGCTRLRLTEFPVILP